MNKQFIDKQKLAEQFVRETGFSPGQLSIGVEYIDNLIDKQPVDNIGEERLKKYYFGVEG